MSEFRSQVGVLGESRGNSYHCLAYTAWDLGLDGVFKLLERCGGADGSAGFHHQVANRGDAGVVDKAVGAAVRIGIDGDALLQWQALDHLGGVDGYLTHEERKCGRDHGGICGGLGGMDLEFDAVLGSDQGGVGGDFVAVDGGLDRVIDGAEGVVGPFADGGGLGSARDARYGGLDVSGLASDERREVAVGVDDFAALIDGPVVHPQVGG